MSKKMTSFSYYIMIKKITEFNFLQYSVLNERCAVFLMK